MIHNKISTIYFTYKRAIMLDASLKSLYENFQNLNKDIHIIYHYDKEHHPSYEILFQKYPELKNKIIYREKENLFSKNILKLFRPLNLLWIFRWPQMIKNFNNFKKILEEIIKNSKNEFIMFVPDDQIFYKKTLVPIKALELIKNNRNKLYYRFFTGNHFEGKYTLPKNLKIENFKDENVEFFKWSNNDKNAQNLWKYRFTIEGTVFHKEGLMKLLAPMLYHNPITLEANGLWESRFRGYFKYGLSSCERTAAGYQINNVQNLVKNQCAYFEPDVLAKAYLDGYQLYINKLDFDRNKLDIVPKTLNLYKENIENKIDYNKYKLDLK